MHSTCLAQAQLYVTPKLAMSIWRVIPLSTRSPSIHLWATLMEIAQALRTKYQTRNSRWHPKFNSCNCNNVFRQNRTNTIPHTSDDTRCHLKHLIPQFRLNKHNLSMSLAAPKANPIFHAANKNLIPKNTFRLSPSYFFIILPFISYKLSEGTNNTKRGNNST